MLKEIVVKDKWNNKYIYDCVYRYRIKKGKLYIYSKANNTKSFFLFNLIYVSIFSVRNEKLLWEEIKLLV